MATTSNVQNRTLRMRAFFIISITVVAVLLLLASAGNASGTVTATRDYRVQPGDTLWEIAGDYGPSGVDVRRTVAAIERVNGITGGSLAAGQVIRIPVGTP